MEPTEWAQRLWAVDGRDDGDVPLQDGGVLRGANSGSNGRGGIGTCGGGLYDT